MAAAVRSVRSIPVPTAQPGEFFLELIIGTVILSQDPDSLTGAIFALVETGNPVTQNRSFVLMQNNGLVVDEAVSKLKYVCKFDSQVPMWLFERVG